MNSRLLTGTGFRQQLQLFPRRGSAERTKAYYLSTLFFGTLKDRSAVSFGSLENS
jgi:hypothetical protein